MQVQSINSYNN